MLSKFSRGRQLVELALKKVKLDECQVLVTSTATSEILATPLVELTDSLVSPEPDHACNSPIVQGKTCDKRYVNYRGCSAATVQTEFYIGMRDYTFMPGAAMDSVEY